MRRVLVTGANKGIGLAIARKILAEHSDTEVILGSRDIDRGNAAAGGLASEHPEWSDRILVLELDVSSDDSVVEGAKKVASTFEEDQPLFAIVNNAGVGYGATTGLAPIFEVNTRGIRRVCQSFFPLLDASCGRVANLTSAAGPSFVAKCSPERQSFFLNKDLTWSELDAFMSACVSISGGPEEFAAQGLGDGDGYGLSKACANSLTVLLARENRELVINSCTPGYIETDMTRPVAEARGRTTAEMGMKPPAEGTRSALFLLFGEPEGSGHYYGSDAVRSPLDRYRAPGAEPYRD